MQQPPDHAYSHPLLVKEGDIDEMGHVNNVVYLRWVQEVAAAHWQAVTPASAQANYSWVVLRHEIDYHRPAFVLDEVMGYTWVGAHNGPKILRHVALYRKADHQLLARALTTWCLLDACSQRPKRIPEAIATNFAQGAS